jgi:thioesterase domain-containing protein/acyl carrier protein
MIAESWRSLLGFDEIGRHADFQDLGGDSLLAVRMLGEIEQALGRRVPIDTLSLEGATIVALARWIDGDGYRSSLVQLREGDPQRNLFVTPVAGGHLSDYFRLVDVFEGHHTILGVRPRGLNSEETPDATMDALAVGMLDTLVGNARGESLDLMGYSFGALSAYEVAYQACLRNVRIRNLILIDPPLNWSAPFPTLNWGLRPVLSGELTELSTRLRHLTNFVPPSRRIDAAHLRAALRFRPKPFFDVRTLVIVGDGQEGKKRMLASWPTLLNENVQITAIPARHTELMRLPTVARTAHVVSDWIATSPEPGS